MKRIWSVVGVLAGALLFGAVLSGADKKPGDDKKPAKDKKQTTDKKPAPSKRLPNHYNKLNLKDDQKEKIYKIKAQYGPEISTLAKRLSDLREKQRTRRPAAREQLVALGDRIVVAFPSRRSDQPLLGRHAAQVTQRDDVAIDLAVDGGQLAPALGRQRDVAAAEIDSLNLAVIPVFQAKSLGALV